RIKPTRHMIASDATRGEPAAQHFRQSMALTDGNGGLGRGSIEPVAPGKPAHGSLHAEIGVAAVMLFAFELVNCPHAPRPVAPRSILCQASVIETSIRRPAPQLNLLPTVAKPRTARARCDNLVELNATGNSRQAGHGATPQANHARPTAGRIGLAAPHPSAAETGAGIWRMS